MHVEIPVTDLAEAREFYSRVFGWRFNERLGFTLFETGTSVGGSLRKVDRVESGGILLYIGVDDVDKKLEEIEEAGGRVVRGKAPIPMVGWDALFEDVCGNASYLFTPLKKPGRVDTRQ